MSFGKRLVRCVYNSSMAHFERVLAEISREELRRREWPVDEASLHKAVSKRDAVKARRLVEAGVDPDSVVVYANGDRFTALHWAVCTHAVDMVEVLLDLGSDASAQGRRFGLSGTPLEWAERYGRLDIVRLLQRRTGEADPPQAEGAAPPPDAQEAQNIPHPEAEEPLPIATAKESRQQKLDEALRIQDEINEKRRRMSQVRGEKAQIHLESQQLQAEISELQSQPGYKNDRQIEKLIAQLQDKRPPPIQDTTCPICFDPPRQVYSCVQCDNWICGSCKDHVLICPICRQDFSQQPPKRNKTSERMLGL